MVLCCKSKIEDTPDETHGPALFRQRGCTDLLCLLLFAGFWCGTGYITYLSMYVGKPWSVLYGADYMGNRCGRGDYADRPKIYFPRLDADLLAQADIALTYPWRLSFYGLCVEQCPNVTSSDTCFANPDGCRVYDYGPANQRKAEFYYAVLPSVSIMNRCVPTRVADPNAEPDRCAFPACDNVTNPWMECDETYPATWKLKWPHSTNCQVKFSVATTKVLAPMAASPLTEKIRDKVEKAQKIGSALLDALWEIPTFGLAMPLLISFTWLLFLRIAARTFTYIMIFAIGLCGLLLSVYFFAQSRDIQSAIDSIAANMTALGGNNASAADAAAWAGDAYAEVLGLTETSQASVVELVPTNTDDTYSSQSVSNPTLWRVAGVLTLILTVLYYITMCMARKRIRTAVALVKETTVVIAERPLTMLYPVNTICVQMLHLGFVILVFAFLFTADINSSTFSDSTLGSAASTYAEQIAFYNKTLAASGAAGFSELDTSSGSIVTFIYLYLIFGAIWTYQFIAATFWTGLSGSVTHWYFFRADESAHTKAPLARSLGRVLRYHLGTIAAGSLVISIVKFVRLALMTLDRAMQKQQEKSLILKLVFKCVACCLWCLDKTLQYITAYAYIYVAMQGTGFCVSCFATFSLIVKYPLQLSINAYVRWILTTIQLLSTPIACGWLCNYVLWDSGKQEPVYATALVVISAYVIAGMTTTVFSCVIDTLFVCCARDMAEYKGTWLSDRLRAAFDFDRKVKLKGEGKGKAAAAEEEKPPSAE